jgi:hypothetical protein
MIFGNENCCGYGRGGIGVSGIILIILLVLFLMGRI